MDYMILFLSVTIGNDFAGSENNISFGKYV